jgi:uncharacterized membrane protein YkvA (DUF1232 family)
MSDEYSRHYSETSFWQTTKDYAKYIGGTTLENAVMLYYVGIDPNTPAWAKGVITAALGYLIFPLDSIPDVTPFVGYADDAGAIAMAVASVAMCITKDHRSAAKGKMQEWFGSVAELREEACDQAESVHRPQ